MELVYTAKAKVTGGRAEGKGETDDGNLNVTIAFPKEMGGTGRGTNPEQLFAIGYAACFEGAMGLVARNQNVRLGKFWIDSEVRLYKTDDGGLQLGVKFNINLPESDEKTARAIVDQAHQVCPYSKATRGNLDVKFNLIAKQA